MSGNFLSRFPESFRKFLQLISKIFSAVPAAMERAEFVIKNIQYLSDRDPLRFRSLFLWKPFRQVQYVLRVFRSY